MLRASKRASSRVKELLDGMAEEVDVRVSDHVQSWMHHVGLLRARAKLADSEEKNADDLRVVANELEALGQPIRVGHAKMAGRIELVIYVLEDGTVASALAASKGSDPTPVEKST